MVTSLDETRVAARRRVGHVVADLLRRERVGDVDERSPWANQAKGMTVPLKRSEGWWQPIIGGCGAPSGSRPGTWNVAIGSGVVSSVMS